VNGPTHKRDRRFCSVDGAKASSGKAPGTSVRGSFGGKERESRSRGAVSLRVNAGNLPKVLNTS